MDSKLGAVKIIHSINPDVHPTAGENLPEFIWKKIDKWSYSDCLECGITGKCLTYDEVCRLSRIFAWNLRNVAKVVKQSVVAIVLPNSWEFVIALIGSWLAGCTVCPLNPILTHGEIRHLVGNCKANCIMTDDGTLLRYLSVPQKRDLASLQTVIHVNSEQSCTQQYSGMGYLKFGSMLKKQVPYGDHICRNDSSGDTDVALLIYSSGTTGNPKGIQLTHLNLCYSVLQGIQKEVGGTKCFSNGNKQEVIIDFLPMCHIYGLYVLLIAMRQGAKIVLLPKFKSESFLKCVIQHKPTMYYLVTPIVDFMVSHPKLERKLLENTHTVCYGATPISNFLLQKFLDKFGNHIFLRQMYGMTEIGPTIIANPGYGNTRKDSIGRLVANTKAKVVDSITGEILGPNEIGELCIKGPSVMKGYLNNEKATKSLFDSDGFAHTGDLVYCDEDGWFYIIDRIKDIIKVKGYLVSPSEIEEHLLKMIEIIDVAVVGIPLGTTEAPRAFIVVQSEIPENQIHDFLEKNLAPYKRLSGGIEFVKEIPRSYNGKVLKRVLLEKYLAKTEHCDVQFWQDISQVIQAS